MTPGEQAAFEAKEKRRIHNRDKQRRWRLANGSKTLTLPCTVDVAAALLYCKKQWQLKTDREVAEVALRYLAIQTRKNPDMKILDLDL